MTEPSSEQFPRPVRDGTRVLESRYSVDPEDASPFGYTERPRAHPAFPREELAARAGQSAQNN